MHCVRCGVCCRSNPCTAGVLAMHGGFHNKKPRYPPVKQCPMLSLDGRLWSCSRAKTHARELGIGDGCWMGPAIQAAIKEGLATSLDLNEFRAAQGRPARHRKRSPCRRGRSRKEALDEEA